MLAVSSHNYWNYSHKRCLEGTFNYIRNIYAHVSYLVSKHLYSRAMERTVNPLQSRLSHVILHWQVLNHIIQVSIISSIMVDKWLRKFSCIIWYLENCNKGCKYKACIMTNNVVKPFNWLHEGQRWIYVNYDYYRMILWLR